MTIKPNFKPRTREEIEAENERIRQAAKPDEQASLPKITPQQRIATLKDRVSRFRPFPMPDVKIVIQEEPKLECPMCGGTGSIKVDVPINHPRWGKLIKCPAPDCPGVQRNQLKRQMSRAEQEARHFGATIEYYPLASMNYYPEDDRRRAVGAARIFLKHGEVAWDSTVKKSLVFWGQVGRGKTGLMSAMRNALYERGDYSQFRKVRTLLKAVQRGYASDAVLHDYEVEEILSTAPYLFIDELETGFSSGDRMDIFEAIIDHRCRENLPTIIATNIEQDEIREVWNDRIASRLIHMAHWIEMAGGSLRNSGGAIRAK